MRHSPDIWEKEGTSGSSLRRGCWVPDEAGIIMELEHIHLQCWIFWSLPAVEEFSTWLWRCSAPHLGGHTPHIQHPPTRGDLCTLHPLGTGTLGGSLGVGGRCARLAPLVLISHLMHQARQVLNPDCSPVDLGFCLAPWCWWTEALPVKATSEGLGRNINS